MSRVCDIQKTDEQHSELTRLSHSARTSVRLAQRKGIVLLAAPGLVNNEIAQQLGVGRVQVARWRERWLEAGLEGIERFRQLKLRKPTGFGSPKPVPYFATCGWTKPLRGAQVRRVIP